MKHVNASISDKRTNDQSEHRRTLNSDWFQIGHTVSSTTNINPKFQFYCTITNIKKQNFKELFFLGLNKEGTRRL